MAESTSQPAPGSREVPSCAPFWRKAGAVRLSHRADVACLWAAIAGEAAVAPLRDGLGLPLPCYAHRLVLLIVRHGGCGIAGLALRHACIMSQHIASMPAPTVVVDGMDSLNHGSLLAREASEICTAWSTELAAGRCTILATASGSLNPKAAKKVGTRLRRTRQGRLFSATPSAADLLRLLAEAEIRRHLPKARATVAPS